MDPSAQGTAADFAELSLDRTSDDALVIRLGGSWRLAGVRPDTTAAEVEITSGHQPRVIAFDTTRLAGWDSGLLAFLTRVMDLGQQRGVAVDRGGLPSGVQRLLALAEAVPVKDDAQAEQADSPLLERIGSATISAHDSLKELVTFVGESSITFAKLLRGGVRIRTRDLLLQMQQVGAEALGIVSLINFLVGLILAFVAAAQLQQFGASIYVANLVGIAMVRDMAAVMTAIVMAGRSGAAYAAEIASMKVNQEVDAMTTMGISPLEFLVTPRIIALCLMMPLLTLYADVVGILGGAFVGVSMLDLSLTAYMQQTINSVGPAQLLGGLVKAFVYGLLIAMAGCLRGLQSGTSSAAVGSATTSAVVTSIILVVSACGALAVIFYALGIP